MACAKCPLELRRFKAAVGDNGRRPQHVNVPYSAQRILRLVIEKNIRTPRRKPDRIQVVHAADTDAAFDEVGGQAEQTMPVRCQKHAGEMGAG